MENNNQSGTSEKLYRAVKYDGNVPPEKALPYFVIMEGGAMGTVWPKHFHRWSIKEYLIELPPSIQDKDAELDLYKKKVEFYRETTDKVREFIFGRNDIGEPNQPLFDAILDKFKEQDAEIERLKGLLKSVYISLSFELSNASEDDARSTQSINEEVEEEWYEYSKLNNL
jgi:hypothetical protein